MGKETYRSSSTTKAHNGGSSSTEGNLPWRPALEPGPGPGSRGCSEPFLDDSATEVDQSLSRLCSNSTCGVEAMTSAARPSKEESLEELESGGG